MSEADAPHEPPPPPRTVLVRCCVCGACVSVSVCLCVCGVTLLMCLLVSTKCLFVQDSVKRDPWNAALLLFRVVLLVTSSLAIVPLFG